MGPVLGPMVMAGVLVDDEGSQKLRKIGAKDSKMLTPRQRNALYEKIVKVAKAYKIAIIPVAEIDAALKSDTMNLNWLEAHTSAKILNELKPEKIFIDSPSVNTAKYKQYLLNLLENKKIEAVVEHKADVNYVECSAASILAKVTRDAEIEKLKKELGIDFGSGYLSDERTVKFLNENYRKHPDVFRKTWTPYKLLSDLSKNRKLGEF
ncbi:MAG: ribonuclease HII [Candidatus Woesearchaeota archaeon]